MQTSFPPPSERSRLRRLPAQASYRPDDIEAILDAAYVCHVAFADGSGVHCIPTACWREGGHLYIHGSNGSRMLRGLEGGAQCCVTVTHLDGLVLARSAFNHSMNYRSAVIYGSFERVTEDAAKRAALDAFMDKLAPGRNAEIRRGNDKEFAATTVMRIALDEAVAKVRTGPPIDDEEDMDIPVWTGVLPLVQMPAAPVVAADVAVETPAYVRQWQGVCIEDKTA